MNNKGLGRGLSSLIPPKRNPTAPIGVHVDTTPAPSTAAPTSSTVVVDLPLSSIGPNPLQPRQQFDHKTIQELAQSISTYGLMEPVIVTQEGDRWQLVAGERRFRAFQHLKKKTIPAIVRTASELERLELALIENIQREDLHPIEKATGYAKLVNDFGLTQQEASKKLGIARSTLANSMRLLDLPAEIQAGLAQRTITEGHAKVLLGLSSAHEQMALYKQMTSGSAMSVSELTDATASATKKQRRRVGDFELQQVERKLESRLGTKVTIKQKGADKRQIVIDTFSSEEFKGVVKKIGG